MARAARAAVAVVCTAAGLAVTLAAFGWLYIVQPKHAVPGGAITDALPLDELSRRSAVPVLVFVGVWAAAALLLGGLARLARAERLTAALLLALGVGALLWFLDGTSIAIVRQIPAEDAFAGAAKLQALYIPPSLAGLAGALLGRPRASRRARAPLLLAALVAASGAFDVLDGMLPRAGHGLLGQLAPEAVRPLASALIAPAGVLLLVLARGLARRKRRAWQLATLALLASTALHLVHGLGRGAILTALVSLALVARRHDFDAAGDPAAHPRAFARALTALAAVYGFGAAALWVNRVGADQPYTFGFALRETTRALVGLNLQGSAHLAGAFGHWFPLSILVLGLAGALWVLAAWLAPWRYRLAQEARERELARALVATWGEDTLAPFVLRADKSYFFGEGERAFLAYRVVGGVAIVSGDPIGPQEELPELVERFVAFAHARDWRIAILGVSERSVELYRRQGLRVLYHGDEAVLETATFSLDGRPIRKVRQSVQRLRRLGYRAEVRTPDEVDGALRRELEEVARAWRGTQPERGFVMALDALFRQGPDEAVFVIGCGPGGDVQGFLHFAVCRAGAALSLSSMPRLRTTPNGFNEWLVCETAAWAREHGFERVSLNFAPFAAVLAPEAELNGLRKLERQALLRLKGRFQLDNLLLFNRKFFPSWEPRFVVYERRLDLPRVGIAALAAEAYLPFQRQVRQ
jgi:lysyl-tRNA synthetase class 2